MELHKNARTCPARRILLAHRILGGMRVTSAAEAAGLPGLLGGMVLLGALVGPGALATQDIPSAAVKFSDDFENGLSRWVVAGEGDVGTHDAGAGHGRVLKLRSNGDVHALIRGSQRWGNVALEGDMLFPETADNYLGVIYNYRECNGRSDFGLVYIKYGRSVYLQANPHRDYNVSRTFYPEFVAPLAGASAVRVGEWQRFRVEVVDGLSHFYVGDLATPQLVFPIPEPGPGMLGLQPRSVGGDVWVDNVTARSIERFSYSAPPSAVVGTLTGAPETLRWEVLGPLPRTEDTVARGTDRASGRWRSFALDPRGAIETGRVIDYHGPNTVAYFRTVVRAGAAGLGVLRVSSVDDLAVWVNGRFNGFIPRQGAAWFDYGRNPDHHGQEETVDLLAGDNLIVIRVRGGTYASGGFYACVEQDGRLLASPGDPGPSRRVPRE
jgi:hypothetical protein